MSTPLKNEKIILAKFIDWKTGTASRAPGKNETYPNGLVKDLFEFNSDQIDRGKIFNSARFLQGSMNDKYFDRYPEHEKRKNELKDLWFYVNTKAAKPSEPLISDNFYVVRPVPPFGDQGEKFTKFSIIVSKNINSINVEIE